MNSFNLALLAGALGKVTLLLAIILAAVLLIRRAEPRWRVLLVRAAILAVPVVLLAHFLEPQLHLTMSSASEQLLPVNELAVLPPIMATESLPSLPIEVATPPTPSVAEQLPIGVWILLGWLTVAGLFAMREGWRLWRISRDASGLKHAEPRLQAEWRRVCAEFGVRPGRLCVTDTIGSPFLTPGVRSALVIPVSLAEPDRIHLLRHVFRHEAAHLKNHDAAWIPAARFLSCLVWFHPLAWWLASLHLRSCEEASDAEAARHGGAESYRGALARLALDLVPLQAPAATFLRLPSVQSRLSAVSSHCHRRPPSRWLAYGISIVLAAAGGLLGTIGFAQDAPNTSPIADKLNTIVIPDIEFDQTPLDQALEFLRTKSVELDGAEPDPQKKGINILISGGVKPAGPVSLRLANATLGDAIRYTCEIGEVGARIDANALVIVAKADGIGVAGSDGNDAIAEKLKRIVIPNVEFHETPLAQAVAFLRQKSVELDDTEPDPARKGVNIVSPTAQADVKISLKLTRIPLGDVLRYTSNLAGLELRTDGNAIAFVQKGDSTAASSLPAAADDKEIAALKAELQKKRADLDRQLAALSKREAALNQPAANGIEASLKSIIVPLVDLRDTKLTDAIQFLVAKSRELDPKGEGVNIIIKDGAGTDAKITLKLSDVPLIEAIRYCTELSRMQFTVEEYAVVIQPKNTPFLPNDDLFTKVYALSASRARTLSEGKSAKEVLVAAGIDFDIPGASGIYNASTGQLIVRNTSANLEEIEQWVAGKE